MSIKENLLEIKSKLPKHCELIAVSKTKPNELILEAYHCGQKAFGENYVQELCSKQEVLPKDIEWHFIGHLQSNKVKYIAPFVHLIHGVDSLNLLKEINKQAIKVNRKIPVLLQYFIASEESKFGLDDQELQEITEAYEKNSFPGLIFKGLMGMASNTEDEELITKEFKRIHLKQLDLQKIFGPDFTILSTGMSSDYSIAVANGSTMVRIGSSIFGARNYSK